MDCGRCGLYLDSLRPGDVFFDGDEIKCPDCETVNHISVDAEQEEVWVQRWVCKHGKDDDTPCPECDAEDEKK